MTLSFQLCPKFYQRCCFPSYDWVDIWLADTDDPVRYGMHMIVIPVFLLFIDLIYDSQPCFLFFCQPALFPKQCLQLLPVSPDVLQLFFDRCTDLFLQYAFCTFPDSGNLFLHCYGTCAACNNKTCRRHHL